MGSKKSSKAPAKKVAAKEAKAPAKASRRAVEPETNGTASANKSTNVASCFRADERAGLTKAAKDKGLSVSAFMRKATLKAAGIECEDRGPGRPKKAPAVSAAE